MSKTFEVEMLQMEGAVRAAESEIGMAVMFHETWKPAAYDIALHERMGNSFATHSFQIVRWALRREMLLALMRLWDTNKQAIRMTAIATTLRDDGFFAAMVHSRAERMGLSTGTMEKILKEKLESKRQDALKLVWKYSEGGTGFGVIERLRALRHARLAHHQLIAPSPPHSEATDDEVEYFYADSLELVRLLLSLVVATAFDFSEATDVYRHHAKFFWTSVRGESAEGHPDYRGTS